MTPDSVTHVASSTGHLCWAEKPANSNHRLVCRTRAETTRIVQADLWPNVSSVAATTQWVYFTSANTLLRWDRTATKPAKVADDIGRVKAIGDIVWGIGTNGHVVRIADGGSTVDYGSSFVSTGINVITTGVTASYLYVSLSFGDPAKPNTILRVNENEGEVETIVSNACATAITGVGALDKNVYFLCNDDNIYRITLP